MCTEMRGPGKNNNMVREIWKFNLVVFSLSHRELKFRLGLHAMSDQSPQFVSAQTQSCKANRPHVDCIF